MNLLATYSPWGARPHYYAANGLAHGVSIRSLMPACSGWDAEGVREYLARAPQGWRTCFENIRAVPPGHDLVEQAGRVELCRSASPMHTPALTPEDLIHHLERAVAAVDADGKRAALALSGGLDSALVLALAKRLRGDLPVFTLASHLPGYCELTATATAAQALGVRLEVIEVTGEDFVAALPEAVAAMGTPLFNLHPVGRWLLACELHRRGFEVLITGDGADPLFAGSDPRNYLPLVGALTRAAGLDLRSPFFDAELAVVAPGPAVGKPALVEAARLVLPPAILNRPKTPCYAPPLDVSRYWNGPAIAALAAQLGVESAAHGGSAEATLWTTLGLLARYFD